MTCQWCNYTPNPQCLKKGGFVEKECCHCGHRFLACPGCIHCESWNYNDDGTKKEERRLKEWEKWQWDGHKQEG